MLDDINSMLDYEFKQAAVIGKAIDIILQPKQTDWHDDRPMSYFEDDIEATRQFYRARYGK